MTKDHRRVDAGTAQEILLDDPGFLREIAERVVKQILGAEMTEQIGAAPYERGSSRTHHRVHLQPVVKAPGNARKPFFAISSLRIGP